MFSEVWYMLAPSSVVKATAKTALGGRFYRCIIACTVFVFTVLIGLYSAQLIGFVSPFSYTADIAFVLFAVLLFAPLFLGLVRFFWRLIWDEDDSPVLVFHYFSSPALYMRALKLVLFLGIRVGIAALLLYLPAIVVDIFSGSGIYDMLSIPMPLWISNFRVISVCLKAVAGVGIFFISLKWYMAPFLYVADEEMDALEAIHMSSTISRGTTLDFFLLILSCTHWIILSLLLLPIVFTLPYFIAIYIVHCRYAVTHYNKVVDLMNDGSQSSSFETEV